jgi:hypothetical protein
VSFIEKKINSLNDISKERDNAYNTNNYFSSLYNYQDQFTRNGFSTKKGISNEKTELIPYPFKRLQNKIRKYFALSKIKTNFNYAQNIIDKVLERYTSSIGVQILNENNFIKYGKMINGVLLNEEIQKNLFEINFAIVYMAEKTFYQKEENPFYKRYLCKLLSELNETIKSKEYWCKLLSLKITLTLQKEATDRSKTIMKEEKKKKLI